MNGHLFVYGSLVSTQTQAFGRALRQRLARESTLIGPATLNGRLYDLGRYPGAVDGSSPREVVHGELVALAKPLASLLWLDAYEGIRPGGGREDEEYKRVERIVRLIGAGAGAVPDAQPAARDVKAWVYLYRRDVTGMARVASGRWVGGGGGSGGSVSGNGRAWDAD